MGIKRRSGIALIITLLVATLLVLLVGAFVVVNRSNNAITGNLVIRQNAYNACLSGLHFAWARLEENQLWGSEGFPTGVDSSGYPVAGPKVRIRIYGDREVPDDLFANRVEGEIVGTTDRFTLRLVNNLQSRHVVRGTALGDIPGRTARLEVVGTSAGVSLKLQSVLRKTPYVDSSALSSDDMEVGLNGSSLQAWNIRSKDPYVNQVRSNRNIIGPSAVDDRLKFRTPPRGGVAMAKEDVKLGGSSLMSSPTLLANSQRSAEGSFQMGTPDVDVPDLERANLRFPEAEVTIPEGEMNFSLFERHDWVPTVFYEGTANEVTRWQKHIYQHDGIEHNENLWVGHSATLEKDPPEINGPTDGYDAPDSDVGFLNAQIQMGDLDDFPVLYETDEDHRMSANLQTGEIALTPGTTFVVDGTLDIVQLEGAHQAHIKMAHVMEADGRMIFRGGDAGADALQNPSENSSAITTTGDLMIDGIITGFGSLFGDEKVELRAKSGLRADLDLAVAVHGDSIRFDAEDQPGQGEENVHLVADFEAYKDALDDDYNKYDKFWEKRIQEKTMIVGNDPNLPTGTRHNRLDHPPTHYWNLLKQDLDIGDPPDFTAAPFGSDWAGPMTLDKYVRLREYARGEGSSWLVLPTTSPVNPGPRYDAVTGEITSNIGAYSRWADQMFDSSPDEPAIEKYMKEPVALLADVFFVGLVHAGDGGFWANANKNSMLFEGSLVSKGQLAIDDAAAVHFLYNRLYLDDVVRQFFGDSIQLDQVYYKIQ